MKRRKKPSKKPKMIRFRPELFWDVDPKTIDPKKHARYVIERILDFGKDQEIRWIWYSYPSVLIHDIAKNSRVLHSQTRPLWVSLTSAQTKK